MIAILAMAAQAAVAAPDEIVVFAHRLDAVSVRVARDAHGKLACELDQSSGDAQIDAQFCVTAARCVGKGAIDNQAVKACIDTRKPDLLREFTDTFRTSHS